MSSNGALPEIHIHPGDAERTFYADGKFGRINAGLNEELEGPQTTVEILGVDGGEVAHTIILDRASIDRDPEVADTMAKACVASALESLK